MALVDPARPHESEHRHERGRDRPAARALAQARVHEVGQEAVRPHVRDHVAARKARAPEGGGDHSEIRPGDRARALHHRLEHGRHEPGPPAEELEGGLGPQPGQPHAGDQDRRHDSALGREANPRRRGHGPIEKWVCVALELDHDGDVDRLAPARPDEGEDRAEAAEPDQPEDRREPPALVCDGLRKGRLAGRRVRGTADLVERGRDGCHGRSVAASPCGARRSRFRERLPVPLQSPGVR
jgi:hypothetical protein